MFYRDNEERPSKLVLWGSEIRRVNPDAEAPMLGAGFGNDKPTPMWTAVDELLDDASPGVRKLIEALVTETQELRDAVPAAALKPRF